MNSAIALLVLSLPLSALARPRAGGPLTDSPRVNPVPVAVIGPQRGPRFAPPVRSLTPGEGSGDRVLAVPGDVRGLVTSVDGDVVQLDAGGTPLALRTERDVGLTRGDQVVLAQDPRTGARTLAFAGRASVVDGPAGRGEGVVTGVDVARGTLTLRGDHGELSFAASRAGLRHLRRGERIRFAYERVADADVASDIRRVPRAALGRPAPRR